jgi:N-acetylglucosamine-6-phosphate deacetylase
MISQVVHAHRILTPHEELHDRVILIQDGRITAIGHRDEIQVTPDARDIVARDTIVVPGFVDIHIHGAAGHDVMEATPKALGAITQHVAHHGTTSIVATTVSASADETCRSLEGIAAYIASPEHRPSSHPPAAEILGVHLEGPFISPIRRGAHPESALVAPSIPLLERFLSAAAGTVRILTLAPELPGSLDLIDKAVKENVVVALGHTDANYEQAREAIQRGARHAVHVFNGMRPFSHRDTGVIGAVLTHADVTAEIIADGIHVDSPAVEILLASKGPDRVILVSDGIAATGMPDGNYRLGTTDVRVTSGIARSSEGKLAGSTLTLDAAIRNMVELNIPLIDAVRMATLCPARRLGLAGKKGVIAVGADADLVFLRQDLTVAGVMTRGIGPD